MRHLERLLMKKMDDHDLFMSFVKFQLVLKIFSFFINNKKKIILLKK